MLALIYPRQCFFARVLEGLCKQVKQIQTKHTIVKNPKWLETNQLAIYKCGRGFQLGATENQIQVVVRAGLKPGTAKSDMMTTRPRCLCLLLGHCTRIVVTKQ